MKSDDRALIDDEATRLPTSACPTCGYEMDSASSVGRKATPKPGDFSLCMRCGAVLRFDAELRLEPATSDELTELDEEGRTTLLRAQAVIRKLRPEFERYKARS